MNISFNYTQSRTITYASTCDVPSAVVEEGDKAIATYLDDHKEIWNDDLEQELHIDYGDREDIEVTA